MDFRAELQRELADATKLVWQLQNGLTEGDLPLETLVALGDRLTYRAGIIQGHLSRWQQRRDAVR